jgi:tetratricopeptide (TPR) repeat protein
LCDGLPLGLRLAAEHVAASPHASVRDLADNLKQQRRLLLDTGSHGDDASATLRAVFTCSFDDLNEDAARMYRLLGLLPSTSFSTPSAAALAELSPANADRLLDVLLGAHLVDRLSGDRFQIHDLLFLFASELADSGGQEEYQAALRRLLDWYLSSAVNAARQLDPHRVEVPPLAPTTAVISQTFETEESALHWCIIERANILAASQRAAELDFHGHAWRLIGEFDDVLIRYGDPRELLDVHRTALTSARLSGAQEGIAGLLNNLAFFYASLDDFGQAATYFRQAQALYKAIDNVYGEAVSLLNIASMYMERGSFSAAISLYGHAVDLFVAVDNEVGRAHAYHRLGDTYRRMGWHQTASNYYQHALRLREDIPRARADTLTALGELHLEQNDLSKAVEYCEAALTYHRRALDTRRTAKALETLSTAYCRTHRHTEAIRCGDEALQNYRAISDLRGQARSLEILGISYSEVANHASARDCWAQALALFQELGDPRSSIIQTYLDGGGDIQDSAS